MRATEDPTTVALYDRPNRYAPPARLELLESGVHFCGYQEYVATAHPLKLTPHNAALQKKQELLEPYFTERHLAHRSVVDLGANSGFFCFWALQRGADKAIAVDMDALYIDMLRKAREHLQIYDLEIVRFNVADWEQPEDIVLALALVHWVYSCTATFGSLSAIIEWLARCTKYMLIIEWVAPEDPAIDFFHHLDWNREVVKESYSVEAFEQALGSYFARYEIVGEVTPSRRLYAAFKHPGEIDLSDPLPLILPKEKLISSRCLAVNDGLEYWSRVYDSDDCVLKQTSLDLAEREAVFLSQVNTEYFPRVVDTRSEDGWSVVTIEKIRGIHLDDAKDDIGADPGRLYAFTQHCLNLLGQLQDRGIIHRDIRPDNILVRDDKPVLIDFGWAISAALQQFSPFELGGPERPPDGSFCDTYSMGKILEYVGQHLYPAYDHVIQLMTEADASMRIHRLEVLRVLFASVRESLYMLQGRSEGS